MPFRQVAVHVARLTEGTPGVLISVLSLLPAAANKFRSSAVAAAGTQIRATKSANLLMFSPSTLDRPGGWPIFSPILGPAKSRRFRLKKLALRAIGEALAAARNARQSESVLRSPSARGYA